ncbi:MAG: PmoA family protein [Planctomycetes bacterium]|nr:PmoA family protein [Planctomycetota bacterium]
MPLAVAFSMLGLCFASACESSDSSSQDPVPFVATDPRRVESPAVPLLLPGDPALHGRHLALDYGAPRPATAQRDGELGYRVVVPLDRVEVARQRRYADGEFIAMEAVIAHEEEGRVRFEAYGDTRLTYVTAGAPKPYFHPVLGPGGVRMNRAFPMEQVEGEERDHVHHRGIWFAHGDVDGVDFWTEGEGRGTIRHEKSYDFVSGLVFAAFRADATWLDAQGRVLLRDERRYVFIPCGDETVLDVEIQLRAPGEKPVVLGDTKEGLMAFRLSEELRAKGPRATGVLVNSEGQLGEAGWGKNARWIDCSGKVGDATLGVAIFDHPQNLRHPTPWHARTYGLLAANPFGLHDFQKAPKGTGSYTLEPSKPLTLRYRFLFHRGDATTARIAERAPLYR